MSKTPYEIRYDLLSMAKDMLDRHYNEAVNMSWHVLNEASERNKELYKTFNENIDRYVPKMFTPEEVINQAKKLQEFIDNK